MPLLFQWVISEADLPGSIVSPHHLLIERDSLGAANDTTIPKTAERWRSMGLVRLMGDVGDN